MTRFRDAFLVTIITQGSIVFLGAVNSIIVTRSIGPEGRGVYSLLLAVVSIAVLVLGCGLTLSNIYSAGINKKNVSTIFTNSVLFIFTVSLLIVSCYFGLPNNYIEFLFFWIDIDYVGIVVGLVLAALFFNCVNSIYLGLQKYRHYGFLQLLQIFIFFICNVVFLYVFSFGLKGVLYSWLLSHVISLLFCVVFLYGAEGRMRFSPDIVLLFRDIKIGGRALISSILDLLILQSNLFIIRYFLGIKAVGIYSVAFIVSDLILRIPTVGGTVLSPKVSSGNDTDSVELTLIVSRLMAVFGVFVSLFMVFFGKFIIGFVFGQEFMDAYTPMIWLLPGIIGLSIHAVLDKFLAGKGYPFITVWSAVATLITILVLSTIFVRNFGLVGAALASSIGFWLITLIKSFYFSRQYSVPLSAIYFIKISDLHVIIKSLKLKRRGI